VDAGTAKAGAIDRELHPERVVGREKHRVKLTFTATYGSIPYGGMFHQGEGDQAALLKWQGRVWAWTPKGAGNAPGWIRGSGSKS
jgi:hypothetical protein